MSRLYSPRFSIVICISSDSQTFNKRSEIQEGSTPQSSNYTATYHLSRKLSKLDEPDMRDTAGKVGTNSLVTYSSGPLHMDEQRQDDQLEIIYNSSVPIQDVALKTYRERWTIEKGGGRGSGRSVLAV